MSRETKYFTNEGHPNINASAPSSNPSLTLAYRTFGDAKNSAVILPSCFGGTLDDTLPFLYTSADDGPSPILRDYYVIVCTLLGGGESSSPSNAPAAQRGPNFPAVTYEDNIRLQYALCQALGVAQLAAYIVFSMGGQQAYHIATLYPDFVQRIVVLASSARTSWHNRSFLEGPKAALVNSVGFHDGQYQMPARRGTMAFGRVFSTWALSQAWFRRKSWETLGFRDLEAYLQAEWEFTSDAHDLLCQLQTWQAGDISLFGPEEERGDLAKALAHSEEEVKHLKNGELRVIESIWGHIAGGGVVTKDEDEFIQTEIRRFLHSSSFDSKGFQDILESGLPAIVPDV
ncbi:Alpha/Beta hydrolase protein [Mycena albidolilacea]|uniref:Alpha/Beta hydrolase protein n=1 Tax=Mycena albidolilacea TaxID=1033008 RepID=A0AAD7EU64_9AGAR|nr:Alpha/Beta hydrolase protein [Mycena albidolilacea]